MLGACATGTHFEQPPDGHAAAGTDTRNPDAPIAIDTPTPAAAAGLLITEVVLAPTAGEFIEIANPTGQTVNLATYYLADCGAYFQIPAGTPAIETNDFIARFPANATIAPGAVVTVAVDSAANFQSTYGVAPTFSIGSGTMTNLVPNTPTLTNTGELVALFEWDGQADLVRDVDLVLVGVPTTANGLVDKTAQAIDGPDGDSAVSSYRADARTMGAQPNAPNAGHSTKRIALETGHELHAGSGNGIDGEDETSEDTTLTWDTTFSAPTPGTLPVGLL